jgi:hypothetical protein
MNVHKKSPQDTKTGSLSLSLSQEKQKRMCLPRACANYICKSRNTTVNMHVCHRGKHDGTKRNGAATRPLSGLALDDHHLTHACATNPTGRSLPPSLFSLRCTTSCSSTVFQHGHSTPGWRRGYHMQPAPALPIYNRNAWRLHVVCSCATTTN